MANKGLNTFTGDGASNLLAGQCATYYFTPNANDQREIEAGVGDFIDVDFFFALKARFSVPETEVVARSLIGDDLSKDGEYGTHPSKPLTMTAGDIIYGCFDKVYTQTALLLYMKLK
jgi:hypothetical protein